MDMTDIDYQLLAGMPIKIDGAGLLYVPTLKEIIGMGLNKYYQYISALMFDKSNIEDSQDVDLSNFGLMVAYSYHNQDFQKLICDSLSLFFKKEAHLYLNDTDVFFYFGELSDGLRIHEGNFAQLQEIIMKSNHIKIEKEPEFKPFMGNSKAQELIEMFKKNKKNRPKPKETINLHSIISGLSWRENGHNMLNIFDLTIYQLYIGFFATSNIDNHYFTLSAIYAGAVDGSKINMPDISWAKILNND